MVLLFKDFRERLGLHDGFIAHNCAVYVISLCYTHFTNGFTEGKLNFKNDNSSGRSAIYRLPTRKLLAVDRIFIYGFVSLISVLTGNGNPLHFKSIFPVVKPTASFLLIYPPKPWVQAAIPTATIPINASEKGQLTLTAIGH